jgi:RHS repeat-associated protein
MQTQYTYDPFGNTSATGISTSNPAQYTGRENDGTGLYYYRARYYDPTVGRFISEDPIQFRGGGTDFYSYVRNSPTQFSDPEGLRVVYALFWYPQGGTNVGHTMTLGDNGETLNSQWPNSRAWYAQNDTLSLSDTIAKEGRNPDYSYLVWVPDDAAFNAASQDHRSRPEWNAQPKPWSNKQTNCVNAVGQSLHAGGVPVAGWYQNVADLGNDVANLSTQSGTGKDWAVYPVNFNDVPGKR